MSTVTTTAAGRGDGEDLASDFLRASLWRDLWLRSGWDPQEQLHRTADGILRDGWDDVTISSQQRCLFSTALPGPSLVFRDLSTLSEEVVLACFSQTGR